MVVLESLLKVVPVLLLIPLGWILRKAGVVRPSAGGDLTKLFVNVALPASLFLAFLNLDLGWSALYLPFIGLSANVLLLGLGFGIVRFLRLHKQVKNIFLLTLPVFATGTIAFPFFIAMFGAVKGLSIIALLEIGNVFFWNTFDHYLAFRLGGEKIGVLVFLKKLFRSPILWAVVFGLTFSFYGIDIPLLSEFLLLLAGSTILLIMLALGISFEPKLSSVKKSLPVIITKTSLGLLVAFIIIWIVRQFIVFDDFSQLSLLVYASVPASAVTFAFASEARLGKCLDANLLSIAFPIGAVLVPLMLIFTDFVLSPWMILIAAVSLVLGLVLMEKWD